MIDHGVHSAGRDGRKQARTAHGLEGLRIAPVRLSEDADPQTFGLKKPGQKRRTKGRMIDIGISGDEEHIELVPAALFHFSSAAWNESHVVCFCQWLSYFRCALLMSS